MEDLGIPQALAALRVHVILVTAIFSSSSVTKVPEMDREVCFACQYCSFASETKTLYQYAYMAMGSPKDFGKDAVLSSNPSMFHAAERIPLVALYNLVSKRKSA